MNQYSWSVKKLICVPETNGLNNVVSVVEYQCEGTDGINTAVFSGSLGLKLDSESDFIAFENLTESNVLDWVLKEVSKEGGEEIVARELLSKSSVAITTPQLPWV
jgi:hypothetical protein